MIFELISEWRFELFKLDFSQILFLSQNKTQNFTNGNLFNQVLAS